MAMHSRIHFAHGDHDGALSMTAVADRKNISAALDATAATVACTFPLGTVGMTEASERNERQSEAQTNTSR